ncbi:hypothetical protein Q5P01_024274 [Channa striata]|uniref:Uncharacterized protein n=1 Tax=Channa striata TaxID=64152 RepID=A0AA88LQA3_CHASR|nr:hypothetical protein Q5P01_024274 [Channa striata]
MEGQWKQCCHHLMKIEAPSSKKSMAGKQGSLYHEIERGMCARICRSRFALCSPPTTRKVIDDPATDALEK